jgi:hypothetical protein
LLSTKMPPPPPISTTNSGDSATPEIVKRR